MLGDNYDEHDAKCGGGVGGERREQRKVCCCWHWVGADWFVCIELGERREETLLSEAEMQMLLCVLFPNWRGVGGWWSVAGSGRSVVHWLPLGVQHTLSQSVGVFPVRLSYLLPLALSLTHTHIH